MERACGCVFFIRFFALKVKKKMHEADRAEIGERRERKANREKNMLV